jgi:hypothetical protein
MTSIPLMDETRPLVSVSAGFGNQWLQEIQRALKTQFANIGTEVVAPSAVQINTLAGIVTDETIEERLSTLEQYLVRQNLPDEAYDFNDAWWSSNATDNPWRRWVSSKRRDEYLNVPWAWGTNIPDGKQSDVLVTLIDRTHSTSANGLCYQTVYVLFPEDGTYHRNYFYRAASDQTLVVNEHWNAYEFAVPKTTEIDSGDLEYTTVCQSIDETCPP